MTTTTKPPSLTYFENHSPLKYLGANKIEATRGNKNGQYKKGRL